MLGRASIPLSFLLIFAPCASVRVESQPVSSTAPVSTTLIRWRIKPGCLGEKAQTLGQTREDVSERCRDGRALDFISVALSGGTKAAVFSGEALFYLDFLSLPERTSVISAVSGGSFADAVYALSCDPGTACRDVHPQGRERPLWNHPDAMQTLGQGYKAMVDEQTARAVTPVIQSTASAGRFADIIDERFTSVASPPQGRPSPSPISILPARICSSTRPSPPRTLPASNAMSAVPDAGRRRTAAFSAALRWANISIPPSAIRILACGIRASPPIRWPRASPGRRPSRP